MPRYALLILPSSNRVYAESATALTLAELAVFSQSVLGGQLTELAPARIGGVPYITFSSPELTGHEVAYLANLSAAYALFLLDDDPAETDPTQPRLRPVELRPLARYDDDLITIQKYQGKTNEQFTKLLINVTLMASTFAPELPIRKLALLDPLCGRGTTLNQALMYGWDASGLEIDGKDFEAYSAFIQTWLKRKRLKHHAQAGPIRRERQILGKRLQVSLAAAKDDYKSGLTQQLDVVNADTVRAKDYFKPEVFHLIVADAPYGVQHGSRTGKGLARSPLELLTAAVPGWVGLLAPGGALGISWNTFVARRADAAQVLADSGLEVRNCAPYLTFHHRVDQAINRDVIVGVKPIPAAGSMK